MLKVISAPKYIKKIYGWLYNSDKVYSYFDKQIVQSILSLRQSEKLHDAVVEELSASNKVLQIGVASGDLGFFIEDLVGVSGKYDVIDICLDQVQRANVKFFEKYMSITHQDGRKEIYPDKYDVILCYLLLKEVPMASKAQIVNSALSAVKEGGKVIFIDYHNPVSSHPLRYIVRMFNRLYQPFAEKMWEIDIRNFSEKVTDFSWRKTIYFGGFYQKTVATKIKKQSTFESERLF